MPQVLIADTPLDVDSVHALLSPHPCCGARVEFVGVVRNHHNGKNIVGIEYECFQAMAVHEMDRMLHEAIAQWPIHDAVLAHRIGRLQVGEISVVLVVLSPHRRPAFAASQYIIDELKQRVPIWKKEYSVDGSAEWTT